MEVYDEAEEKDLWSCEIYLSMLKLHEPCSKVFLD